MRTVRITIEFGEDLPYDEEHDLDEEGRQPMQMKINQGAPWPVPTMWR